MSRPVLCIKPHNFNESNLVINEPKVYQDKNSMIKITSDILYQNSKGELCELFMKLPSVDSYGPSPQYDFSSKNKVQRMSKVIKFHVVSNSLKIEVINRACQSKMNEFAKSELSKKSKLKPDLITKIRRWS